jgi:tRNA pseudouridine38-40 synthase
VDSGQININNRVAMKIQYDGTYYHGSQYQKNAASVQKELEMSVTKFTGHETRVKLAGRTDAGVHAEGQVIAFDTWVRRSKHSFMMGINHFLPNDIRVKSVHYVPTGFDPRRQAISRRYRYSILNDKFTSVFWSRYAHYEKQPLDIERMKLCLPYILGKRNFAPFSAPIPPEKQTVREIYDAHLVKNSNVVVFEVEGNAFLPQQVRRIASALIQVGIGKMECQEFQDLTNSDQLGACNTVAPPNGLCLMKVKYNNDYI